MTDDRADIPFADEETRSLFNEHRSMDDEMDALEFELQAKERLRKLTDLVVDVKVQFVRNSKIFKLYKKNGRMAVRMLKVVMWTQVQTKRELYNLQTEFTNYRNSMGKTEEEMCATNQLYNKFITFTKQALPILSIRQDMAEKLMKYLKLLRFMEKNNN